MVVNVPKQLWHIFQFLVAFHAGMFAHRIYEDHINADNMLIYIVVKICVYFTLVRLLDFCFDKLEKRFPKIKKD